MGAQRGRGPSGGTARVVDTPCGPISYVVSRKRVKNLNLHIGLDGTVALSIPWHCPLEQADSMIRARAAWIRAGVERMTAACPPVEGEPDREEARRRLGEALEQAWRIAAPLKLPVPELKLRRMRSQWGNCHYRQGYITLNTHLARCPEELRVYVALHELVHFRHPDHGPGFYRCMDGLMPDWRERRRALGRYAALLRG